MSTKIKLYNPLNKKLIKAATFPENFDKLLKIAKEFVPSEDNTKRYQLIELKANREIINQQDFELMANEYQNEKTVKILVNLVDKKTKYLIPDKNEFQREINSLNQIINESNVKIVGNNEKENLEENVSNPMNKIIKIKLKELEDKLVDELYNNSMMEIEKSKILNEDKSLNKNMANNFYIHKGINCNKCGKEIIGERFKCIKCKSFNLCQICEKNYNHDMRHIMVSILYPLTNESEFAMKLDKNMSYKNENMNYSLEPKIFYFDGGDDIQIQEITIKNIGTEAMKGVILKCIENKSEIIGQDCEIHDVINPGNEIKAKIEFFNIKGQLEERKNVYYSFFEMFNERNESFGNVSKVKIIVKN